VRHGHVRIEAECVQAGEADTGPEISTGANRGNSRRDPHGSCHDSSQEKLAETLAILQRQRWKQGDKVAVEVLLREYPGFQNDPDVFALIYGEFLLREESGETPSLEQYRERFPEYAGRLNKQIEMHRML